MEIFASEDNLKAVRAAIQELVAGNRLVKVDYSTSDGYSQSKEYTSVSLSELRDLERELFYALNPVPVMESIDVEIEF